MKKFSAFICCLLIVSTVTFCFLGQEKYVTVSNIMGGSTYVDAPTTAASPESTTTPPTTSNQTTITLSFVGDLLCATDARTSYAGCFREVAKEKPPTYFLSKVKKYFKLSDKETAEYWKGLDHRKFLKYEKDLEKEVNGELSDYEKNII